MQYFHLDNNPLSYLAVSKNIELKELDCTNNLLIHLDCSKNTALTYIDYVHMEGENRVNILKTLTIIGGKSIIISKPDGTEIIRVFS